MIGPIGQITLEGGEHHAISHELVKHQRRAL
jgi:hypothetical protein